MKRVVYLLVLIVLSVCLYADQHHEKTQKDSMKNIASPYSTMKCYRFDKNDFIETLPTAGDIVVSYMIEEIEPEPPSLFLNFAVQNTKNIPSLTLQCVISEDINDTGGSRCENEDGSDIRYSIRDGNLYLRIDYLALRSSDLEKLYSVRSGQKRFSKGVPTECRAQKTDIRIRFSKKDNRQQKLAQSITIPDSIIYGLRYNGKLAIAFGEDNTPGSRNLKAQHGKDMKTPLLLRTRDGGSSWERLEIEGLYGMVKDIAVLDEKHIVFITDDTIYHSGDSGDSWQEEFVQNGIDNLRTMGDNIIVTPKKGSPVIGTKKGELWQKPKATNKSPQSHTIKKSAPLALLHMPDYKVDYQTGDLSITHNDNGCGCRRFDISLNYRNTKKTKGLIGKYWSLSIESYIKPNGKDTLLFFDAENGRYSVYTKDKNSKGVFRYKNRSIEKTDNGYAVKCDGAALIFDKNGKLVEYRYRDRSYTIVYENGRIDRIVQNATDGNSSLYIGFRYPHEGVRLHHEATGRDIVFVVDSEGVLREVVEDDKRVFGYLYEYDNDDYRLVSITRNGDKALLEMNYETPMGRIESLLEYDAFGTERLKHKRFIFRAYEDVAMTIVETSDLKSNMHDSRTYYFSYGDTKRQKLLSTSNGTMKYIFNENGLPISCSDGLVTKSVRYDDYGKIDAATIDRGGKVEKFVYRYDDTEKRRLREIKSDKEHISISYNDRDEIDDLRIGEVHLGFTYNEIGKPAKVIVYGKGEINSTYDKEGKIDKVVTKSYTGEYSEAHLSLIVAKAMSRLDSMLKEGSIERYPCWL